MASGMSSPRTALTTAATTTGRSRLPPRIVSDSIASTRGTDRGLFAKTSARFASK